MRQSGLITTLPFGPSRANDRGRPTLLKNYAYSKNYLIDTEHGVIVDVEAPPARRTTEVESAKTMLEER